jgi:hypothetical protein
MNWKNLGRNQSSPELRIPSMHSAGVPMEDLRQECRFEVFTAVTIKNALL